jgi:hypothetical protein
MDQESSKEHSSVQNDHFTNGSPTKFLSIYFVSKNVKLEAEKHTQRTLSTVQNRQELTVLRGIVRYKDKCYRCCTYPTHDWKMSYGPRDATVHKET